MKFMHTRKSLLRTWICLHLENENNHDRKMQELCGKISSFDQAG